MAVVDRVVCFAVGLVYHHQSHLVILLVDFEAGDLG
jgi:hypothetical protein